MDFRKGHDGLAALVQSHLQKKPFDGAAYVFRAKRADRLKMIWWDGTGLVMAYKRLEQNAFKWPAIRDGEVGSIHPISSPPIRLKISLLPPQVFRNQKEIDRKTERCVGANQHPIVAFKETPISREIAEGSAVLAEFFGNQ